ncbi:cysteine proteinase COT44-like [Rosa rugosa]|uniref:cysteine proteinase COT44-like n=1 Tax=Rosa rugosa TaxID=74645 RepID=UPI002B40F8F0|nr:cysteine proteinase COT44-like [Rosa rugosa]
MVNVYRVRKEFQSNKCRRTTVAAGAGIKIFNSSSLDGEINTCNVNVDWSKDIWSENGAVSAVSPQVLDCAYGDRCEGGSEIDAYVYIMKNMGLASEKGYPYTEKNGTCDENREDDFVEDSSIDGLVVVRPQTENELRRALCRRPVTAEIAANSLEFEQYDGGIFNGPCGQDIDHTVLVVGFGSDENGVEYWKIQNFWGESWGEQGYMRLALEAGGKCQIAMEASFPLVE